MHLILLIAGATALALLPVAALADDGAVVVPWGDWLQLLMPQLGEIAQVLAGLAFSWFVLRLPKWALPLVHMFRIEQLMRRAVDYGVNAVDGGVAGKTLSVKVANAALRTSLRYAVDQGGSFAASIGDERTLSRMIVSRLAERKVIPEDASVVDDTGGVRIVGRDE